MVIDGKLCFCDRIKDDLFNLFYIRYRLYREIYCHPKVISFELVLKDIFEENKNIFDIIKNKDIENFCELTDYSVLSECSKEKRKSFELRNKYKPDINGELQIVVNVGLYPMDNIYFYNRKNPTTFFKIKEINILSKIPSFTESISYSFSK
jgi:HD superfamily phosphohydrolase